MWVMGRAWSDRPVTPIPVDTDQRVDASHDKVRHVLSADRPPCRPRNLRESRGDGAGLMGERTGLGLVETSVLLALRQAQLRPDAIYTKCVEVVRIAADTFGVGPRWGYEALCLLGRADATALRVVDFHGNVEPPISRRLLLSSLKRGCPLPACSPWQRRTRRLPRCPWGSSTVTATSAAYALRSILRG